MNETKNLQPSTFNSQHRTGVRVEIRSELSVECWMLNVESGSEELVLPEDAR